MNLRVKFGFLALSQKQGRRRELLLALFDRAVGESATVMRKSVVEPVAEKYRLRVNRACRYR